eukprot:TRINITY_DN14956_c0_g1_i1.p1 TRINITY_DN14956_c0_g1~~TRINITY_DN14956_c0_g1_i1.p1  ORF type:complete len:544 (-),score=131.66 TRINITY_DN14956_c0_g1_i1:161-1792(-)
MQVGSMQLSPPVEHRQVNTHPLTNNQIVKNLGNPGQALYLGINSLGEGLEAKYQAGGGQKLKRPQQQQQMQKLGYATHSLVMSAREEAVKMALPNTFSSPYSHRGSNSITVPSAAVRMHSYEPPRSRGEFPSFGGQASARSRSTGPSRQYSTTYISEPVVAAGWQPQAECPSCSSTPQHGGPGGRPGIVNLVATPQRIRPQIQAGVGLVPALPAVGSNCTFPIIKAPAGAYVVSQSPVKDGSGSASLSSTLTKAPPTVVQHHPIESSPWVTKHEFNVLKDEVRQMNKDHGKQQPGQPEQPTSEATAVVGPVQNTCATSVEVSKLQNEIKEVKEQLSKEKASHEVTQKENKQLRAQTAQQQMHMECQNCVIWASKYQDRDEEAERNGQAARKLEGQLRQAKNNDEVLQGQLEKERHMIFELKEKVNELQQKLEAEEKEKKEMRLKVANLESEDSCRRNKQQQEYEQKVRLLEKELMDMAMRLEDVRIEESKESFPLPDVKSVQVPSESADAELYWKELYLKTKTELQNYLIGEAEYPESGDPRM